MHQNRHVAVGARRPGARRRRRRTAPLERSGHDGDLRLAPGRVAHLALGDVATPEHREVRLGELVVRRQVEPNLEELDRIRGGPVEQREHLGVHDAASRGQPLRVARSEARRRPERIGVVDVPAPREGHSLEPAVGMRGESRHGPPVVHAPAVLAGEVLAELAPGERRGRPQALVAGGIRVVVVHAEEERVRGLPREPERTRLEDGCGHGQFLPHCAGFIPSPPPAGAINRALSPAVAPAGRCRRAIRSGSGAGGWHRRPYREGASLPPGTRSR